MSLVMQRGSGALIAVMIVLLMGTLMLHATRLQLSDAMSLVGDERRYIQQFTGAMSALAWGERLRWPAAQKWQCQHQTEYHWRACVASSLLLLRADSGPGTLALWRWIRPGDNGAIHPQPHGWLDFCPLAAGEACHVE